MSFACCSISTPIATAYDSLGESGLQHSLNEPGCPAIFTNAELLPVVAKVVGNVPTLRLVVDTPIKIATADSAKMSAEETTTKVTQDPKDFFDAIGNKVSNLTPGQDDGTAEGDDEPRAVEEIESLCMTCHENVRIRPVTFKRDCRLTEWLTVHHKTSAHFDTLGNSDLDPGIAGVANPIRSSRDWHDDEQHRGVYRHRQLVSHTEHLRIGYSVEEAATLTRK